MSSDTSGGWFGQKDRVDLEGFFVMVVLTLLWGLNYPAIKISNVGFAPIFNAFLRSSIASAGGILYCVAIREPLVHRDIRLFHGFIVGLLFVYRGTSLNYSIDNLPVVAPLCGDVSPGLHRCPRSPPSHRRQSIEKNPFFKDSQGYEHFLTRLGTILTDIERTNQRFTS